MNNHKPKMKHPSGLLGNDDGEQVEELSLRELIPFPDHPFHVIDNEELHILMESIQDHGVMVPIIVRPKDCGTFEIVGGHRRTKACQLLGLETIPAFIRDLDDEDAIVSMVDTNIQRESLLFSEKAFAYKMKLEALKKKAGRPKKNSSPVGENLSHSSLEINSSPVGENLSHPSLEINSSPVGENLQNEGWSIQQVAENTTDSARNIQRYIRLTELSPDLLQMVDKKKMPFQTGVELSYLTDLEQMWVYEWILQEKKKPSLTQATLLKQMSQEGLLNQDSIEETLTLSSQTTSCRFSPKIKNFFQKNTSKEEIESVILELLSQWKQNMV